MSAEAGSFGWRRLLIDGSTDVARDGPTARRQTAVVAVAIRLRIS